MIIILVIFGLLLMTIFIGKVILSINFNREVKNLFSRSKDISDKRFNYNQLSGLPKPVQRYFKHVLKQGQPYINNARLTHDGKFKKSQDKEWMNIKGEQYFTADEPGFIWKGTTSMFTARDMYIADKGRLVITLLSLINVVEGEGENFDEGEFQRWLAECVWFPTNLLPSDNLEWLVIDTNTAKLIFNYKNLSVYFIVTFNDLGEITQMETKRYMGDDKKETWLGKLTDYKQLNGILVPTKIEAIWKLEKGDLSYAKFKVKKLEYNKPEKY